MPGKRIAIVQSNYVPWKGYFDLIARVDEFVLFDDRQYTRRDWRNRNRIKTPQGTRWMTIPVEVSGRYEQRIDETVVADAGWPGRHLDLLAHAYREAPYWSELEPWLRELYEGCAEQRLSAINRRFLEAICARLGITTPLTWSTDYEATGRRTERLLTLCLAAGATTYVSGPAAREYLEEEQFAREGIAVEWMAYEGYPEYPQLHGAFEHAVSVLDVLLSVGPQAAPRHVLGAREAGVAR